MDRTQIESAIDNARQMLVLSPSDSPSSGVMIKMGQQFQLSPIAMLYDQAVGSHALHVYIYLRSVLDTDISPMPTYDAMEEQIPLSRATIATAITRLRIARWMAKCMTVRESGRVKGSVYAIFDQPLGLYEISLFDPDYIDLLETSACTHRSLGVREAATGALERIRDMIAAGERPYAPESHIDLLERQAALAADPAGPGAEIYYATPQKQARLARKARRRRQAEDASDQGPAVALETSPSPDALIWPEGLRLTVQHKKIIAKAVFHDIDPDLQQPLLDQLAAAMRNKQRPEPIRDPIAYLSGLAKRARNGEFAPSSGALRIAADRDRTEQDKQKQKEIKDAHLARLKRLDAARKAAAQNKHNEVRRKPSPAGLEQLEKARRELKVKRRLV